MAKAVSGDGLSVHVDAWFDGPVGLAVTQVYKQSSLPIEATKVKAGLYRSDRLIIAGDLRLYNAAALSKEFGALESDVAYIAALYEREGVRGLDRLEGDFTIALWDKRQRTMLVKRDHVGIRSAYYAYQPGKGLAFASLGKSVRASGLIPTPVNRQAQIDHLNHDAADQVSTFHHNLKRLPGGNEGIATDSGFKIHEYWRLKPQPYFSDEMTFEDWSAELKTIFRNAVTKRLPESGPISSHLSSGMDSASISAIAAENLKHDDQVLDAYTFGMSEAFTEEDMLDEVPYARKVAMKRNRIAWTVLHKKKRDQASVVGFEEDRDADFSNVDFEDRAASDAANKGSSVILSGWGGDEIATYTGSGALAELLLRGKIFTFVDEVKLYSKRRKTPVFNVLFEVVGARFLPQTVLDFAKGITRKRDFKGIKRARSGFKVALAKRNDVVYRRGPNSQRNRIEKFYNGNLHWRLEDWAYTGARHGVQYAFPMLDLDLIEHCLRCPPEFLIRDGYNRAGFRTAMQGVLPDEILLNRWKHISTPCTNIEVIQEKNELLAELAQLEQDPDLRDVFDFEAVRKRLHALPTEEAERERLAKWAKKGEQGYNIASGIIGPLANMKRYQKLKAEERASEDDVE